MLRQWLVACCHGNGLFQLPVRTELEHSGDLLYMGLLGKRHPSQSVGAEAQVLSRQLPLLHLHQPRVLCDDEGHSVGALLQSDEATLAVKWLLRLRMEGVEHKVDDWLSHVGEVKGLRVAERRYVGKGSLSGLL